MGARSRAREVERARPGIRARLQSLLGSELRDLRVLLAAGTSALDPRT